MEPRNFLEEPDRFGREKQVRIKPQENQFAVAESQAAAWQSRFVLELVRLLSDNHLKRRAFALGVGIPPQQFTRMLHGRIRITFAHTLAIRNWCVTHDRKFSILDPWQSQDSSETAQDVLEQVTKDLERLVERYSRKSAVLEKLDAPSAGC